MPEPERFDTLILGSGVGGRLLAAVVELVRPPVITGVLKTTSL